MAADKDATPVVWSLFVKLETVETLPDPEIGDFLAAATEEVGNDGLLSGWAIVAALLSQRLIEHAQKVGCDCGSVGWLKAEQIRLAEQDVP